MLDSARRATAQISNPPFSLTISAMKFGSRAWLINVWMYTSKWSWCWDSPADGGSFALSSKTTSPFLFRAER